MRGAWGSCAEARGPIREEIRRACGGDAARGVPVAAAEGQLIRPLLALAGAGSAGTLPPGFWDAVAAVQLAHEASLLHDDIVDGAAERRGAPTVSATHGVARALVQGDHLLTAAYRAAVRTGSLPFVTLFARAVERTVAGEIAQGCVDGALERLRYEEVALGKAGELMGCALATAPVLSGAADADEVFEFGRRVGLLYQMLDDLLDYCPGAATGKPPLADYRQRRWTWVLEHAPELPFGLETERVLGIIHGPREGGSPAARALAGLEREVTALRTAAAVRFPGDRLLESIVGEWVGQARSGVEREAGSGRARVSAELAQRVPALHRVDVYLASNSRSFRFAARFFAAADAERVARVYAYCRMTDDLVDRPFCGDSPEAALDEWLALSRRAYAGECTGIPLLDRVMGEMRQHGVPLTYAEELAEGMRMDLRGERYRSLPELRRYTHRVASVVGLWLTRLFAVEDAEVLQRAAQMGHAMQLTNILRDVGEDWDRGRLYLPADLMQRHGVDEAELSRMRAGAPISAGYRALVEELMGVAEREYAAAFAALPRLPPSFGRAAAVAAHVYRGIHQAIRDRGYDNLRQRACTGAGTKVVLGARAVWELHRASRPAAVAGVLVGPTEAGGA